MEFKNTEFKVEIKKNYKGFYLDRLKDNFNLLLKIGLFGVLFTVVSLIYFIYRAVLGSFDDYLVLVSLLLAGGVILIALVFIYPLFIYRNNNLVDTIELEFKLKDNLLSLEVESKTKKEDFKEKLNVSYFEDNKSFILVGENAENAYLVPKSYLSNEQIDLLANYVKEANCVTHSLTLYNEPFIAIKNHEKTVEMRLNKEKYHSIKAYDIIVFENVDTKETIKVRVNKVRVFKDFEKLYQNYSKEELGYKKNQEALFTDMNKYYSEEEIKQNKALALQIEVINE